MTAATTPVSISDLKREQPTREQRLPMISPGFGDLQSFELLQRIAKLFSASPLVPKEYQGAEGLPSMVIVLNMAHRMQADPLMIAQNLYVVHGRPSWSAQFLIACFNRCGRYSGMRYEWQGKRGDKEWGCQAWAIELATGDRVNGPLVTMATAEAEGWTNRAGSKWKTIPELMLTYRAAAWMVRTNAPEIAMGLPTVDESEDVVTLTREQYSVEQVKAGEHAATPQTTDTTTGEVTGAKTEGPTYAFVRQGIETAEDKDMIDLAESLIDSLQEQFRPELHELAKAKRKALA